MEVLDIARAIVGPWFPVPDGSKFSLRELREVRWGMATRPERGEALNAALAVHHEIEHIVNAHAALLAALQEALLQLEYLQEKRNYATTETVLTRTRTALARCSSQVEQTQ